MSRHEIRGSEPGPLASETCPLCRQAGRCWIPGRVRQVRRCSACGFLWVPQGLARTTSGNSIYETDDPIFLQDGNEAYYQDQGNLINASVKVAWVKQQGPAGGRLLDVGAGFGHFVKAASGDFEATGLELGPVAVAWADAHLSVQLLEGSIYDPPAGLDGSFDAVTMWDVIEHVPDPLEALTSARRLLAPRGRLFLSTPDTGSLSARLLGRRWHYIDPIQHIALFNRQNLEELLGRAGFKVTAKRSFGHLYPLTYVLSRLDYLYGGGPIGGLTRLASRVLRPWDQRQIRINLGDVMALAATAGD